MHVVGQKQEWESWKGEGRRGAGEGRLTCRGSAAEGGSRLRAGTHLHLVLAGGSYC